MRFISYLHNNEPGWGVIDDADILDLSRHEPSLKAAISNDTLPTSLDAVASGKIVPLSEISYLPPIPGPVPHPLHRPELRRPSG